MARVAAGRLVLRRHVIEPAIPECWNGVIMKMVKAFMKRFKKDEDLANHAWVLHVI